MIRVRLLCLLLFAGGCATTTGTSSRSSTSTPRQASRPTCSTRALALSAPAHGAMRAVLVATEAGFAMIWSEQQAERGAVRFLAVDRDGNPRSPSTEVADRPGTLALNALDPDGPGYVVSWSERGANFVRKIDGRGRPRGDVARDDREFGGTVASNSVCTVAAGTLRCKTPRGIDLELPATATVVDEQIDAGGAAVIAADGAGLRLFVQACVAR